MIPRRPGISKRGHPKVYFADRYRDQPLARFGLLASSRDKDLPSFGVDNGYQATKKVHGPWYGDDKRSAASCRHLREAVTEFGAQGLELDSVLPAWGTDVVRDAGKWSDSNARKYKKSTPHRAAACPSRSFGL